jgi:glycerophosphoryl diester phosphodiesterase
MVNVEIKSDGRPPARHGRDLAAAVAAALTVRPARPRLLVSSFDLDLIDAHLEEAPALATGWLRALPIDAVEAVAMVADRGHVAFHPHHHLVDAAIMSAARARGLLVATWTVNEAARAEELDELGVDIIISDVPDAILARRA